MATHKVCPRCGRVLPPDAVFCPDDGAALVGGGGKARRGHGRAVAVICCASAALLACCAVAAAVLLGVFEPREEVWLPVAVHVTRGYGGTPEEDVLHAEIERNDAGAITRVIQTDPTWLDNGETATSTTTLDWLYDDRGRIACIRESVSIPYLDEMTGQLAYTEGAFNHRYSYNDNDRLVREDLDDGTSYAYFWEDDRLVRSAYTTLSYGPTTYQYDEMGRLESLQYRDGDASSPVVSKYTWTYDAEGNVAHHTYEQGSEFEKGPISSRTSRDGSTAVVGVEGDGPEYQVDPETNRILSASVWREDGTLSGTARFTYDEQGHLTEVEITPTDATYPSDNISVEYQRFELTAEQKQRAQEFVELRPTFDYSVALPIFQSPVLPEIDLAYCYHPPFVATSPDDLLDYVAVSM